CLPLSIGVAILKYRLYDIDRLISRTLSYAVVTGLLVGVYVGIVVLTTDVLSFSSPIAVAASTLAAAALFSPVRTRVQRLVDRRLTASATTPTPPSPHSRRGCERPSTSTRCEWTCSTSSAEPLNQHTPRSGSTT